MESWTDISERASKGLQYVVELHECCMGRRLTVAMIFARQTLPLSMFFLDQGPSIESTKIIHPGRSHNNLPIE